MISMESVGRDRSGRGGAAPVILIVVGVVIAAASEILLKKKAPSGDMKGVMGCGGMCAGTNQNPRYCGHAWPYRSSAIECYPSDYMMRLYR